MEDNKEKIYLDVKEGQEEIAESLGADYDNVINCWYYEGYSKERSNAFYTNGIRSWRQYLNVPYVPNDPSEREEAKKAGAHWSKNIGKWYIDNPYNLPKVTKWVPDDTKTKVYITVQYDRKEVAKSLGASWDKEVNQWYYEGYTKEKSEMFYENGFRRWRQYLDVPYVANDPSEREEAKKAGAQWNDKLKKWYIDDPHNLSKVTKWMPQYVKQIDVDLTAPREYLNVSKNRINEAKKLGACWDNETKAWFHVELTEEGREKFRKSGFFRYKETLNVPNDKNERAEARSLGAKYDFRNSSWYIDDPRLRDKVSKWMFKTFETEVIKADVHIEQEKEIVIETKMTDPLDIVLDISHNDELNGENSSSMYDLSSEEVDAMFENMF